MTVGGLVETHWAPRSRRERVLLVLLGLSLILFALWYGVLSPLRRAAGNATLHLERAAATLSDVEANAAEILRSRGAAALGETGFEEALLASASASGVTLTRNRMESTREITVWAEAVDPGALFGWIRVLRLAHGVTVTNLTATRDETGALALEARFAWGAP
jgi:general secretion pathway protein M